MLLCLFAPTLGFSGGASHVPCDPHPVGYCGTATGDMARFCYVAGAPAGVYENATDPDAVPLPGDDAGTLLYLNMGKLDRWLDDPYRAPGIWYGMVYAEKNDVAGLQIEPFACGDWRWYGPEVAHPPQWLGPTGITGDDPDPEVV